MKHAILILSLVISYGCFPEQNVVEEESKYCDLSAGKYKVQSATFMRSSGVYELFLMGAQSCVKQPVTMENLQMAQLNTEAGVKEAEVEVRGDQSILYMSKDFSLSLVSEVQGDGGQVSREQSMWTPFLAGAAGMVAGQMISNAFFNKPRHYQPPVMQPGQAKANGFGGVGDTPQQAKSSYNNTLAKSGLSPDKTTTPKSSFSKKTGKSSNFKKGPRTGFMKKKTRRPFRMKRRRR